MTRGRALDCSLAGSQSQVPWICCPSSLVLSCAVAGMTLSEQTAKVVTRRIDMTPSVGLLSHVHAAERHGQNPRDDGPQAVLRRELAVPHERAFGTNAFEDRTTGRLVQQRLGGVCAG